MVIDFRARAEMRWAGKEVAKAIGDDGNRKALKVVADEIAGEAKTLVPVDSGQLRDSIKGSVRKVSGIKAYRATVRTGKAKNGYRYGLDVEIGQWGRKYKNTPYMVPALRRVTPRIARIYQQAVEQEALKQKRGRGRPRKVAA